MPLETVFPFANRSPPVSTLFPLLLDSLERLRPSRAALEPCASPIPLLKPEPTTPIRLGQRNSMGTVIMAVTVSPEGRTIEARVARGAPYGVNETALKAVRDWQFKPAMREGAPVTCMVMIEATFHLY
jgi:TonB family protein